MTTKTRKNNEAITAPMTEAEALAIVKAEAAAAEQAKADVLMQKAADELMWKNAKEAEAQRLAKLQAEAPGEIADDHPTYQKLLSIMVGMQQVRDELMFDIDAIQAAYPNDLHAPHLGIRRHMVEDLNKAFKVMNNDLRTTARSSGLGWPEGL